MKHILFTLLSLLILNISNGQFVATMEVKEPIEGICNEKEVYALFPSLDGQTEAQHPITKEELLKKLNLEIPFLKDNTKFKGKGMVNIIINCKGEVVQCEMDNKTKSTELDQQIVKVFSSLKNWTPGKLNGKKVDSIKLFSFHIKKGKFYWN